MSHRQRWNPRGAGGWNGVAAVAAAAALVTQAVASPALGQATESPSGDEPEAGTAAATITAADLRDRITALAHDSMRGRDTPSPELVKTAAYVAGEFERFGLRPGLGEGGYQQTFPVTVVEPGPPGRQRLVLQGPEDEFRLNAGTQYVAAPTGKSTSARGPLRYWSLERVEPPQEGVLAVTVTPESTGRAFRRVRSALEGSGAAGALVVVDASPSYFEDIRGFFSRRQVSLGEPQPLGKPVVLVEKGALPEPLRASLRGGGELGGWSVELHTEARVRGEEAMNTIGWLEGSDPELNDEYVVFTAHMDHVGVGEPVDGDSIYNGADDDGSGTATILELAQAFASAEPRPRRSLIFMTVSGEEKGLLGSRWYSEHPVFPLERTVAAVNIDMIGRNWSDTVVAIGKEHSSLGGTVEAVAAAHPELEMAVIDDRWPEQNFYYRSDHYNFARKGVPVLFFFSGIHEDYHRPGDEASEIQYGKTSRIARLIYHLGSEVADADDPPRWDPEAYRRVVEGSEGR